MKEVKIMSEPILKQILSEIQGMKVEITGIKSEITELKSETQDMKSEITRLKSEMQDMKSQMNSRFDSLETRTGNLETKVDIIHNQAISNSERLNTISNNQSKQGKVLESLSLRSLEQEADIRVLKRI